MYYKIWIEEEVILLDGKKEIWKSWCNVRAENEQKAINKTPKVFKKREKQRVKKNKKWIKKGECVPKIELLSILPKIEVVYEVKKETRPVPWWYEERVKIEGRSIGKFIDGSGTGNDHGISTCLVEWVESLNNKQKQALIDLEGKNVYS